MPTDPPPTPEPPPPWHVYLSSTPAREDGPCVYCLKPKDHPTHTACPHGREFTAECPECKAAFIRGIDEAVKPDPTPEPSKEALEIAERYVLPSFAEWARGTPMADVRKALAREIQAYGERREAERLQQGKQLTKWLTAATARAERAEARVKELEDSMLRHFQDEHLAGDGPEISRWKLRVKELEAEAYRYRERADDHDSARQSEKERADYAETRVKELEADLDHANIALGAALKTGAQYAANLAAAQERIRVMEDLLRTGVWVLEPFISENGTEGRRFLDAARAALKAEEPR